MTHETHETFGEPPLYGLLAEFSSEEALRAAVDAARAAGYVRMDAYTPYPVHGLPQALGFDWTAVPLLVLLGGLFGGSCGYGMEYYAAAVTYPLNIGGRPLQSVPSFIPITFELTVLAAGLTALLGMLILNRLPQPHHPLFSVDRFSLVNRDRLFLCIEARDLRFVRHLTREFLLRQGPVEVIDVPQT